MLLLERPRGNGDWSLAPNPDCFLDGFEVLLSFGAATLRASWFRHICHLANFVAPGAVLLCRLTKICFGARTKGHFEALKQSGPCGPRIGAPLKTRAHVLTQHLRSANTVSSLKFAATISRILRLSSNHARRTSQVIPGGRLN